MLLISLLSRRITHGFGFSVFEYLFLGFDIFLSLSELKQYFNKTTFSKFPILIMKTYIMFVLIYSGVFRILKVDLIIFRVSHNLCNLIMSKYITERKQKNSLLPYRQGYPVKLFAKTAFWHYFLWFSFL